MEDSIFTKMIKGEIPYYKVYEDDKTLALLDIYPIQPGHTLVVPKNQVPFAWDLSDDDYQAIMATAKKVARRLREVFSDKKRIGMYIEGLDVDNHTHLKVFPFSTADEFRHLPDHTVEPDHEALAEVAKKLAF